MDRGISEVTAVGGVVSLIARSADGTPAMQLTVLSSHFATWMTESFASMLTRLDAQSIESAAQAPEVGP